MLSIIKFGDENRSEWDSFLDVAKNSHFMFKRAYMEYHKDRFVDFSLLIYDSKDHLVGVFPANKNGEKIISHQGLSFGGLIISNQATVASVHEMFLAVIKFCRLNLITSIIYKRVPDFYTSYPAQEDLYSLFILNSKLVRRDVSVAVDMSRPLSYSSLRKRKIKKAQKSGVVVNEEKVFSAYWEVLTKVLQSKHQVKPVHSIEEIEYLRSRFPDNIKLYTASHDNHVLAGVVVYETELVAHAQYLASNDIGRDVGALDLVIDYLISTVYKEKRYFDFGISTEDDGKFLNQGLISQKEGFGARAFIHDFYEFDIV